MDAIESIVFSRIKYQFSGKIKKKYPNLYFTTAGKTDAKARFPTVFVKMLESPEIGETLEGTEINGVNATFQIEVTDNQSQARADEVSKEVLRIMKTMRFKAVGMPFHDNSGDTYRTVSRYRRGIADNDRL